jgi:hypothetical protein
MTKMSKRCRKKTAFLHSINIWKIYNCFKTISIIIFPKGLSNQIAIGYIEEQEGDPLVDDVRFQIDSP